jgi:hypothetical protein
MLMTTILAAALQAAPAPAAAPTPASDADKKICRNEEVTGSRVSTKRRCQTMAVWAAEATENRAVYQWQREYSRTPN